VNDVHAGDTPSATVGETPMFERLGHTIYRGRRWVLAAGLAVVVAGATWGTGVFGDMTSSGFEDPGSESAAAAERIERTVGRPDPDVVVLYRFGDRPVTDPAFAAAVEQHLAGLPRDLVTSATTYWSTGGQARDLVSRDGRTTYAAVHLAGSGDDEIMDTYSRNFSNAASRATLDAIGYGHSAAESQWGRDTEKANRKQANKSSIWGGVGTLLGAGIGLLGGRGKKGG